MSFKGPLMQWQRDTVDYTENDQTPKMYLLDTGGAKVVLSTDEQSKGGECTPTKCTDILNIPDKVVQYCAKVSDTCQEIL